MDSFMDDKDQTSDRSTNSTAVYTNVCLTVISLALVVISVCSIITMTSGTGLDGKSIVKFAICDPETKRCVKVNAGRRLETTN